MVSNYPNFQTIDSGANLFMEFLTAYPSNVTDRLKRISSSDLDILKSPFPADFPNSSEVEILKNSKISKNTFEKTHFMNFQRAVNNMVEYRNGDFQSIVQSITVFLIFTEFT